MATHSSIPAWEIPWAVESGGGGYSPRGCKRVGPDWTTEQQQTYLFQGKKCKRNNDKVAKDGAGVLAMGKQGTEPVPCLPINTVF